MLQDLEEGGWEWIVFPPNKIQAAAEYFPSLESGKISDWS